MKKAVILFSGGLDSTTCLAYAKNQDFDCYALSFDYEQRHQAELNAAAKIVAYYHVPHQIFKLAIDQFGGSSLTDKRLTVPKYKENSLDIPNTYVPARNTIFLSIALAYAETLGAKDIFIGASHVDYSNYPDCRPEYFAAFQQLCNLATKLGVEEGGITIHTPLIYLSKAQTIRLGHSLGVDYSMTVSCYQADASGKACGQCASCGLRKKGFAEAGLPDNTQYTGSLIVKEKVMQDQTTPTPPARKIYRSRKDRWIAGVCGGIGEYFGMDSTWIRLLFILFLFLGGSALLVYLLLWIIVPNAPE